MIRAKGFTLIELVLVIAILGIISVGFVGFINVGSNVYQNVSNRDSLISDARFAVERLNRELRNALPNSIRIIDDGNRQCLEFVPIKTSHVYSDIPANGDLASADIEVIKASSFYNFRNTDRAVVYPIDESDAYDLSLNKAQRINSVDTTNNTWQITLASATSFASDSPNQHLFIVGEPVSYCAETGRLERFSFYGFNNVQTILTGGVLMAEHIDTSAGLPFIFDAKQQSDAIVQVNFTFSQNNESVFFSNGVHIQHVP
ncbi:type II secretion system protein J [Thalassomonas sp. M1454]|uniref:PulJ/GspJ family protein n=1 Tax=Thalassomonas sp. M1454 TaxID=2594477 RepID=UPI001180EA1E|nr:type II secretion system protein [Thalassomonas sp. M1454]TRX52801.1 type II secretion system protein [Thalassomonas sp. M1454]